MRYRLSCLFIIALLGLAPAQSIAQGPPQEIVTPSGNVIIPGSSVEHPGDRGQRGHTNHLIFVPQKGSLSRTRTPVGETPGSLACVYGTVMNTNSPNCSISGKVGSGNNGLPVPDGGSGMIAIVDAYDYPTAENDLNVFSKQFGLPPCTTENGCFQKVYASGTKPAANCGWGQEAALDIEWAHAMAPNAKIVLVEAASNSLVDLITAADVASMTVSQNGGGQVSMSWGGSEFSTEANNDFHFTTNGVVYFAASGDSGGKTIWPGVSPNVVAAGGTTINRDSSGNYLSETAWSESGGGKSAYESRPSFQYSIRDVVGTQRGVPDISFDANPSSGVFVYDSTSCQGLSGWLIFGGTSVSSPALAGITNLAGSAPGRSLASSSAAELATVYSVCGTGGASACFSPDFRDITSGKAGSFTAKQGWDFVTGVGSSLGLVGK